MDVTEVTVSSTARPWRVDISDGVHQWNGDEPVNLGGGDTAPGPFPLLCSALGTCTAITVQMYAARKQWALSRIEVRVTLNPQGKPDDGSNELVRRIRLEGALDAEQRARLLQIANACPTHKLLTGSIRIPTELVGAP